jgi:hypothetical protein
VITVDWSVVHPADNSETMRAIRTALAKMEEKIGEAHASSRRRYVNMMHAIVFAELLQDEGMAAWACKGPYAALSMVSGLLASTTSITAAKINQEFAELCWRSHTLSAVVSPYANDLECTAFVGAHDALADKLKESGGR